jgi:mono/diheme cytochrome c family protein
MRNGTSTSSAVLAATVAGAVFAAIAFGAAQDHANAQGTAKTVLDGVFTAAQAERGSTLYGAECASCHDGADVDGPSLGGAPFLDRWREDTLNRLFDFIKMRMPQSAPGSLSDAAYVDILAYLLNENSFQAGSRELTIDALGSTLLVGPDGPQPLPPGALVRVVGCLEQAPSREWVIERAGAPSRVRGGNAISETEASAAAAAPLGTQTFTLQNLGESGTALPGSGNAGQKVVIKGALTQRPGASRIHVTAVTSVAASCAQ